MLFIPVSTWQWRLAIFWPVNYQKHDLWRENDFGRIDQLALYVIRSSAEKNKSGFLKLISYIKY